MENYKLLEKYRKRISIYFALFILFSIWLIQGIFTFSIFYNENINLENNLISRYSGVENILKNKESYINQINDNNFTTRLLIEKTLDGVTIIENGIKILGDINIEKLGNKKTLNSDNYKFYQNKSKINGIDYKIIIREENINNINNFIKNYIYFIIFSLPFLVLFYYIAYIFVGYNFKPINETISSLESFSENINHELKTPLTEIISTLSLAQKLKTNYTEAIEISLNSTNKINKILDSMLGIINIVGSSYKKEKLNLISEINEVINENQKQIYEKNIKLITNLKNKSFNIIINKEHLHICVSNLLQNAIKYSNIDGTIHVLYSKGSLEISDNGIGIDKKNLKNIFNKYFRENYTNEEGHGLGLALVRKISDINKWEVSIESEKNKGTIARINFVKIHKGKK